MAVQCDTRQLGCRSGAPGSSRRSVIWPSHVVMLFLSLLTCLMGIINPVLLASQECCEVKLGLIVKYSLQILKCCLGMCVLVAQSCLTLCNPMLARFLCPWSSPGKNTGVGCQFLLLEIFLTQGLKPRSSALAGRFFTT